jgi:uncharacterized protein YlzI (FlbEa/FlbD family)
MLMVTTSTSIYNHPQFQPKSEQLNADLFEEIDPFFNENLKKELDALIKDPSDEVINKILAYAKTK